MKSLTTWRMARWVAVAFCGMGLTGSVSAQSWDAPPAEQTEGAFWRTHWYERGIEHGNPSFTRRMRINSPEVSLHPRFGKRKEARENGLMLIRAEEDLFQVTAAEYYAELWGGHPGTANKRVSVNGRSIYEVPEVGTEDEHCAYSYPSTPLKITDLVNGYNAFQWAVDQGSTFWGHAMVDNACLRVALTNTHPDLGKLGLADFRATVEASAFGGDREGFALRLDTSKTDTIARVDYQAWFRGYDDNGNLKETDWHGFTFKREPAEWIGSSTKEPFAVDWDTSMLPAQKDAAVRAMIRFRDSTNVVYLTGDSSGLEIRKPAGVAVELFAPRDLPKKFWARAGRLKTCHISLKMKAASIERAELYVKSWTGGAGKVEDYFKLNGRHYPVAEGSGHEIQFNRLPVDADLLKRDDNRIELLSDTEHHGIEIVYPGPALMVRWRTR
ncbi:MAG: hypothetical protein ACI9VS_000244 [Candidatus Binatia bacterium]|jgi:hypothetical protein